MYTLIQLWSGESASESEKIDRSELVMPSETVMRIYAYMDFGLIRYAYTVSWTRINACHSHILVIPINQVSNIPV